MIKLKLYNRTGRFEENSIVSSEEKIKIKIEKQLNENLDWYAKEKSQARPIEIKNNCFEIDNIAGYKEFIIYGVKNGETIKEYQCDGLIVKELSNENEFNGEILTTKNELKQIVFEQNSKIEKLEQEVELLHKLVYALIKGE